MASYTANNTTPETTTEAWLRARENDADLPQVDLWLLRAVDAGLAAIIVVVPLFLGGRIALGQFVLLILTFAVALCWLLRQSFVNQASWIHSPLDWLVLAALGLVGLQLVPLPPAVLATLSPHHHEILPLWAPDSTSTILGGWNTISLTPGTTQSSLILILTFSILLLVVVQRVRRIEDIHFLLRWIALATVGMAVFALMQYVCGNGKFFWFYEHPFSDTAAHVKGSFTNRNHFAQFIALGIGPLVWWILHDLRSSRRKRSDRTQFAHGSDRLEVVTGLKLLALGVSVFAALMSLSRGGAMAGLIAVVVCLLVLYCGSLVSRKMLLVVTTVALFVGACLHIYGYQAVANRLDDFLSVDELGENQARWQLWQADLKAAADFPLLGTGLGSHAEVNPIYFHNEQTQEGTEYTHAENGYVQVFLEGGSLGLLLTLSAIGLCIFVCISTLQTGPSTSTLLCLSALAASLAACFAHSATDFIWYIPGCMIVPVVSAGCAVRLWQLQRTEAGKPPAAVQLPQIGWWVAAACLLLLGCLLMQNYLAAVRAEPYWHRYLTLAHAQHNAEDDDRHEHLASMMQQLSAVVRWQPDHARAHARLAAGHIEMFNRPPDAPLNPMDVKQVRDAAKASRFESSETLSSWLTRAFGERREHLDTALRHARQALLCCPLQGEAYLQLADLSFLEGPQSPGDKTYLAQAMMVRPYDGAVLFVAGQEAMLRGDWDRAFEHWQIAFRAGSTQQKMLIDLLAPRLPADFIIETFQPDFRALRLLQQFYRSNDLPDRLRVAQQRYVVVAESRARELRGREAAHLWLDTANTYRALDDATSRIRCLRSAVHHDPTYYNARYSLGTVLLASKEFDEAKQHLEWCFQRKSGDQKLRKLLEATVDGRLRTSSHAPGNRL